MAKGAKKGESESSVASVVLDYLTRQNRPYSVTDVVNNLHGQYTKTQIQKALTQLATDSLVLCKTYGKQSVYVIRQDDKPAPTSEELEAYDAKSKELKDRISQLKEEYKQRSLILSELQSELSNEELSKRIEELTHQKKWDLLQNGAIKVDPKEKQSVDKALALYEKEAKKRRKMVMDVLALLSENSGKNPQALAEEIGLEME